ncbi:GH13921 [Drosophila grimshawi]|uniref:GH13921 n=1 Tax=Drosophila grimshawi TaxID=7222 RepID=B4K134_DROGR|nr:GH13921 [Drosophila grimshawi]
MVSRYSRYSGIHQILVPGYSLHPFKVSWTTVMRRKDGSVDFYRFWDDYKNGFGNLNGEFFIGLDKLHFITKAVDQELLITMEDLNGRHRFAKYDRFAIDGEMQSYKQITLGTYSGGAGESMRIHAGKKFTTRDRDYDTHDDNCAEMFTGAWWYDACHDRYYIPTDLINKQ